jgi:peptidyl-prolyl cis-trans isomerase-like protein 2
MDAIQQLNIKPKNWSDLLTGEKFSRKDIINIVDPMNPGARDTKSFKHMHDAFMEAKGKSMAKAEDVSNIRTSAATDRIFKEIQEKRKRKAEEQRQKDLAEGKQPKKKKIFTNFTGSAVTGSFTSSAMDVHTENVMLEATEYEVREMRWAAVRKLGQKGYVRMKTTLGDINLEIHCDMVPRTSDNFLSLCADGKYDGTPFHRVIRNFMMQGGDPTGTGRGGESKWKESFKDEFDSRLIHDKRGVLSMANSGEWAPSAVVDPEPYNTDLSLPLSALGSQPTGPNSNNSQFFVMFKSATHLDYKHSVFGRMVGGEETLRKIELLETGEVPASPPPPFSLSPSLSTSSPFHPLPPPSSPSHSSSLSFRRISL